MQNSARRAAPKQSNPRTPARTARTRGGRLPLKFPYAPMEALSVDEIPNGDGWLYEPKWDGFRCLAFRDGQRVRLQSKSGQPLERYFPELVDVLLRLQVARFVLDGEIVVPINGRL